MNSATIDETNTRAICDEIGERFRTLLKSSMPDEAADLDDKLQRLQAQQSESGSALSR